MVKNIGFIGCGNMADAMIGGIIKSNVLSCENISASSRNVEKLNLANKKWNINVYFDNKDVVKNCDIIVLSVKPNVYKSVIKEICDYVDDTKIIVTIAAGQSIKSVESMFGKDIKLVRTMPNTPALVGEGMTCLCPNEFVLDDEIRAICTILESFGEVEVLDETLIDVVISTSGSSPAYVFMMIEAMADAAVLGGMKRDLAYKFASQAVLGSAKMVLETNIHPGVLKDMVCSPGGTTIEAVASLEKSGFRNAIIDAMRACSDKSKNM